MRHTAAFIPNPKMRGPGAPRRHHVTRYPNPIAQVFTALAELGLKPPAKIEPDPMVLVPQVTTDAPDSRELVGAVVAGTSTSAALVGMVVDPQEGRRRIREASIIAGRARFELYAEHHERMTAAAPKILGTLDKALSELLDDAATKGTYGRSDYEARYEQIHRTAKLIQRHFTADIDHQSAHDGLYDRWWRFGEPLAVWQWEHELWATAPKKEWNLRRQVPYGSIGAVEMVGFTGTTPTLEDVVHHRDDWKPMIRRSEDVAKAMADVTGGARV